VPIRPIGLIIDGAALTLIAASWWIQVRKSKNLAAATWRWVTPTIGLALLTLSFALYLIMLGRMVRSPELAANTTSVLALVRTYTRFYPTSCGLIGASLGLFGKGASRWTIASAGLLVAFVWSLFTVSLL
jgi:hypothetical protein